MGGNSGEPSGDSGADWGEGMKVTGTDASISITAKDVTTTERLGNAKALLPIMILLSEALPNGMLLNANANGMTCYLYIKMQGVMFASPQSTDCVPYRARL